jgi:hypothetical protein
MRLELLGSSFSDNKIPTVRREQSREQKLKQPILALANPYLARARELV